MNMLILLSLIGTKDFLEWSHFKDAHLKKYSGLEEEIHRIKIYLGNKRMIEKHNLRYAMGLKTYQMEMNQFGDLRDEEFEELYLPAGSGWPGGEEQVAPSLTGQAPTDWDWRREGAVTPVLHQGKCGSCWAFSTTGTIETQVYLKSGVLAPLSNQQLLDCTHGNRYRNRGCHGGLPAHAFRYVQDSGGITTEKAYPYEAKENHRGCRNHGPISVFTNITGFAKINPGDEEQLALAVAKVGTISICMLATKEFKFYKFGVFFEPECTKDNNRVNHAMLLVGYGATASGDNYWLVKNSWGTKWGEDGYIKMARGRDNNCNIASVASYPTY